MSVTEKVVTVTADDIRFVEVARKHYEAFAEAAERQGNDRMAGTLRKQAFYAERFLARLGGAQ